MKFYTIQKAKDIFGLADDNCGFKGKQFSMIAEEDDEIVKPDDGDEDLSNEDLGEEEDTASEAAESVADPLEKNNKTTKSSNSKKASSRSANTKQVVLAATPDTNTTAAASAKKKGTITKRTKAEVAAIQAEKAKQESLEEPDKDETNEVKQPTNRELEKEKRKLNAKVS